VIARQVLLAVGRGGEIDGVLLGFLAHAAELAGVDEQTVAKLGAGDGSVAPLACEIAGHLLRCTESGASGAGKVGRHG
jgi:hypothetical protein